jgi:Tfp pilus assembly protein PilO
MKSFLSLLFISVSVVLFFVFIRPQYQELQATQEQVTFAKSNLETASNLTKSRDELIAKYGSISKTDLDNLKILLPDSVDNIRLIIQVNSLATKNGLSLLRSVDYQSNQDSAATDPNQNPDAQKQALGEFTISFQTTGQYKNFLAFVSDLEQNLRLVDVVKVEITPTAQGVQQNAASSLSYKVTLKTYWLKR